MSTNSLDTNVIVHFILGDVPAQRAQVAALLATPNTEHHIADLALAEAVYVFENIYGQTRTEIVDQLELFLTQYSHCLSYSAELFAAIFPFYVAHPKLSFYDCYLAAQAEAAHAEPLFTFDRKLAAQSPSAKLVG